MLFLKSSVLAVVSAAAMFIPTASAITGQAGWEAVGTFACKFVNTNDTLNYAFLGPNWFTTSLCFETISVTYNGTTVDALIVDECPGCLGNEINLSTDAFADLAPLVTQTITVEWDFE